jgi:oligopeptidase A
MASNPLLALTHPIPFSTIQAEHVVPGVRQLIAEAQARIDEIAGGSGFEGTLGALDAATERLDNAMGVVGHLESVANTPELRAAYTEVQPEISAFYSKITLNEGLWQALKAFDASDEARALTGEKQRLRTKVVADFRRQGADLPPEGKEKLLALDVELGQTTLKFSQNVLDATNAFELIVEDEARLAGLPPSALDAARQSAAEAGKSGYRFTLQAPSYVPVMTYLADAGLREQLYRAFNRRATSAEHDNRPLVRRILELRRQRANLLGFTSFADLVLADRRAKNGETARRFVDDLRQKTGAAFRRENEELMAFRRQIEGPDAPALAPWDISYYAEKQRRALYDLDEEALRPYFAADRVIEGLFQVAARLYGLKVEPWADAPVWDPAVRAFTLRDEHGAEVARFYSDIYPRPSKRDGAWMQGIFTSHRTSPVAVAVFAANLTPPVGDAPALLTHREVETLFHEFGHLLHHTLSKVELRSLGGTNVAWDFVELPSQIMENWCWERPALDLFAHHHATGETLPDEHLTRMRRARTFRAANMQMRQLGFAELDLALHIDFDPASSADPVELARTILERHSSTPLPAEHAMAASFSHLFASPVAYAAGYYSYKWAEVLDADAFSLFLEEGIFDRRVGDRFRAEILSKGDSEDPAELYRRFRGREPSLDPLLERLGLTA